MSIISFLVYKEGIKHAMMFPNGVPYSQNNRKVGFSCFMYRFRSQQQKLFIKTLSGPAYTKSIKFDRQIHARFSQRVSGLRGWLRYRFEDQVLSYPKMLKTAGKNVSIYVIRDVTMDNL